MDNDPRTEEDRLAHKEIMRHPEWSPSEKIAAWALKD